MKRILFFTTLLALTEIANAQIAKWLIEPIYDSIYMAKGIDAVVTESDTSKIIWSFGGKVLFETSDKISDFRENMSVLLKPESSRITGLLKNTGEIFNLESCSVSHFYPYYSCGKLLVLQGYNYRFVGKDGLFGKNIYSKALPFFNGYASCQILVGGKQKDSYALINDNEEIVPFFYNGKSVGVDDVEFISSVNDENVAVVVIKHRLFIFNGVDGTLSPVFASEDDNNLKNQAKLDKEISQCLRFTENQTMLLTAKCGKDATVAFEFDGMFKPLSFIVNDSVVKKYEIKIGTEKKYVSPLEVKVDENKYGIFWTGMEMLPPQFDQVLTCFDNNALVKLNGKYGLIEIDKDAKFSLKINKGKDIAFLHQNYETTIRLDMPTYILSDKTYLELRPDCGIELDKTSREKKNTESGNFVEYSCVLTIPENLSDSLEKITYPLQVLYNELKSPVINHNVNAWFYKKYEVEEDDSQRSVEHGMLTIVFNIKNAQFDGSIVKFDVSVTADTLEVQREDKMSETRYKYKVYGLNEGVNNVVVQVLEHGCPPASFPFEVEYHKPVDETETESAEKEEVVVKKKPTLQKQQSTTPRLEI